jgi:predicted kinase
MSLKLILTKGLPASGKTTWAKEYIHKYPQTANICKDDLRWQLAATNKREKRIIKVRDLLTEHYLGEGYSVIWSDTNLNPLHHHRAKELADKYGAELTIEDFTHISLAECIKRDLVRPNSVGQTAIEQMYYDYLDRPNTPPVYDPQLPDCYLVDVDGTLAHNISRSPFNWQKVGEDALDVGVANLVTQLVKDREILILSGRSSVCRDETIAWLAQHQIKYTNLFMREETDSRPDEIIKQEIYVEQIRDRYNVLGVIDDRPKVCRMWRKLGLSVFQVGNPDYEF